MAGWVDIAASDSGYGILWNIDMVASPGGLYLTPVNVDGSKKAGDTLIASGVGLGPGTITWNGSEFAVFWLNSFARFTSSGTRVQSTTLAGVDMWRGTKGDAVWNGNGYGISWLSNGPDYFLLPYLAIIDSQGTIITPKTLISSEAKYTNDIKVAWNGSKYAVTWRDSRTGESEVYVALFDNRGVKITGDIRISTCSSGCSVSTSIRWDGNAFVILWSQGLGPYMSKISQDGSIIGDKILLFSDTSYNGYTVKWAKKGNEYGAAWQAGSDVKFARFDNAGQIIGEVKKVIDQNAVFPGGYNVTPPAITASSDSYAITWTDNRNNSSSAREIYFAAGNAPLALRNTSGLSSVIHGLMETLNQLQILLSR